MSGHYDNDALADLAEVAFLLFDGLKDNGQEWLAGSISIWKSSELAKRPLNAPTYSRGLTFQLREGMSFVTVHFTRKDGSHAVAIVLRSDDEDILAGWVPQSQVADAERVVAFLNGEIAAA